MEKRFRQVHVLTVSLHVAQDEEPDLPGGVGYLLQSCSTFSRTKSIKVERI